MNKMSLKLLFHSLKRIPDVARGPNESVESCRTVESLVSSSNYGELGDGVRYDRDVFLNRPWPLR